MQKEISFQQFRNQLLAKGLVEKLEVVNKTLVRVYVQAGETNSPDNEMQPGSGSLPPGITATQPGRAEYYFNVGSVDSFERKMEEAQEALGISLGKEVHLSFAPLTSQPAIRGCARTNLRTTFLFH